jgi:hypothetical protein
VPAPAGDRHARLVVSEWPPFEARERNEIVRPDPIARVPIVPTEQQHSVWSQPVMTGSECLLGRGSRV